MFAKGPGLTQWERAIANPKEKVAGVVWYAMVYDDIRWYNMEPFLSFVQNFLETRVMTNVTAFNIYLGF